MEQASERTHRVARAYAVTGSQVDTFTSHLMEHAETGGARWAHGMGGLVAVFLEMAEAHATCLDDGCPERANLRAGLTMLLAVEQAVSASMLVTTEVDVVADVQATKRAAE
jgi:hypothetical protein